MKGKGKGRVPLQTHSRRGAKINSAMKTGRKLFCIAKEGEGGRMRGRDSERVGEKENVREREREKNGRGKEEKGLVEEREEEGKREGQ